MTDKNTVTKWLEYCSKESRKSGCAETCPYLQLQDEPKNLYCEDILMQDALALLTPHVLTLEELKEWCVESDDEPLYMERKALGRYAEWIHADDLDEDFFNYSTIDGEYYLWPSEYGRSWRCWSAKPMIGQMQEVPWDDDAE